MEIRVILVMSINRESLGLVKRYVGTLLMVNRIVEGFLKKKVFSSIFSTTFIHSRLNSQKQNEYLCFKQILIMSLFYLSAKYVDGKSNHCPSPRDVLMGENF